MGCYHKKSFDASLHFFNISAEHKVSFTNIREQYELRLTQATTETDKTTINYHFKLLRDQYDEYFKVILLVKLHIRYI